MSPESKRVLEEALALPEDERAVVVVGELLSSLDQVRQSELDAFWANEAEARLDAYDRGEITATPVSDAIRRIEQRLAQ